MSDIAKKEKIITSSYDKFIESIDKVQGDILKAILSFLKSNSNEKPTKSTLSKINKELKKIITPESFRDPVTKLLKDFDAVEEISKKILSGEINEDLSNFDVGPEKQLEIDRITKGLLNDDALDANLKQELRKILYRYVTTNINLEVAEQKIKTFVTGDEKTDGFAKRYAKVLAIESLSRFDGSINQKVATTYKLDGFRIVGSLIITSQPQCEEMVKMNGRLGKFAVNGKYAVEDLPEIIALLKKYYPGVNRDLSVENYFELRNHWGCRHQFIPTRLLERDKEALRKRGEI
jgi:hypothetical protein